MSCFAHHSSIADLVEEIFQLPFSLIISSSSCSSCPLVLRNLAFSLLKNLRNPSLWGCELLNYPRCSCPFSSHPLLSHNLNNITHTCYPDLLYPLLILVLSFKPAIFGKISSSPSTLTCWFVKIHRIEKRFPVSIGYLQNLLSSLSWKRSSLLFNNLCNLYFIYISEKTPCLMT